LRFLSCKAQHRLSNGEISRDPRIVSHEQRVDVLRQGLPESHVDIRKSAGFKPELRRVPFPCPAES